MLARTRLWVLIHGFIFTACGSPPSFEENESTLTRSKNDGDRNTADATMNGNPASATPNTSPSSTGNGSEDSLGSGDESLDPNDGDTNANGDQNTGAEGDDTSDEDLIDGKPGSEVLVEDGGSLVIPGTKVQRVGLNFEDFTDFDYNDAVMCFEGNFKIEGTSVVSYENQQVTARTFSASGCQHRVDVVIVHADGTSEAMSYLSRTGGPLTLPFRIKSKLEVTVTTIGGGCDRTPITMHNKQYALVKPDVCNDSGT